MYLLAPVLEASDPPVVPLTASIKPVGSCLPHRPDRGRRPPRLKVASRGHTDAIPPTAGRRRCARGQR